MFIATSALSVAHPGVDSPLRVQLLNLCSSIEAVRIIQLLKYMFGTQMNFAGHIGIAIQASHNSVASGIMPFQYLQMLRTKE